VSGEWSPIKGYLLFVGDYSLLTTHYSPNSSNADIYKRNPGRNGSSRRGSDSKLTNNLKPKQNYD